MKAANNPPNPAIVTREGPYARTAAFPVTLAGPLVDGDTLLRDVVVALAFPALLTDVANVTVEFTLAVVVET